MDIDEVTAYRNEDGTFNLSIFGMDYHGNPREIQFERLRLTTTVDVINGVNITFEQCEKPEFLI